MYGRGAMALSREINKQGVETTPDLCQETIDGIAKRFPAGWAWLKGAQHEAVTKGYVTNSFGFRRYFSGAQSLSGQEQSKIKRQAGNAAVQSMVAILLCQAGTNLYRFRYKTDVGRRLKFRPVLPIHDAYLVEVLLEPEAAEATKKIITLCMSTMNEIPGTDHKMLWVDMNRTPTRSWGDH